MPLDTRTLPKRKSFAVLNEALAMLRASGIEPELHRSKHFKLVWWDPLGQRRVFVVSVSCSDRRAIFNARARLRRILEGGPA
jgi:hypothetical protein